MHPAEGIISVLVLNEFASVAIRKLEMQLSEIQEIFHHVRAVCSVKPITIQVYDRGLRLAERYDFPIYDAMIVATALVSFIRVTIKMDFGTE